MVNFGRVDRNLFPCFEAVYENRNLMGTADQLGYGDLIGIQCEEPNVARSYHPELSDTFQSSTSKCLGAIEGALSTWAVEASLTAGPFTALTSKAASTKLIQRFELWRFEARNARGYHMYGSALVKLAGTWRGIRKRRRG